VSGVSAVTRVQAALDAAHASQETLNAFTSIDDEGALERADEFDTRISRGEYVGPLGGVPVALKDLIDQKGRVTTAGSHFYRETPDVDAACVERLETAGAVIIGRAGLHEWAFGFSSENPHWGTVRNPWDPSTSPGGSSGGSAVAVAAGITPIAIGTDTGGSVRVPAALCGTYGLKVTHGRIPLDGVFPLVSSIDTVGPLADSMENLDLAYRAMSSDTTPPPEAKPLRLGIPQPWYENSPTDEDIAGEFTMAVESLRSLGHEVHPIDMPDVEPSIQLWNAIAGEVREVHAGFRHRNEIYGEDVALRLSDADLVTEIEGAEAGAWQRQMRVRFSDALTTVDFLITPTVPVRRKVIGEDSIGDRHYRAVLSYFSALVNHALNPALALPVAGTARLRKGRPPVSIQVIGERGSDAALIAFGQSLESEGIVGFELAPIGPPKPQGG
jgi:aspartyl-tRNA(Asn)/glutamyl-tRNA(Gln) amidotransferase subunit A